MLHLTRQVRNTLHHHQQLDSPTNPPTGTSQALLHSG
uniref:Uncharacterized protein n=1 Tax=Arundo donax TaxID=35708 RepID=A0A0A9CTP9_ARUDO